MIESDVIEWIDYNDSIQNIDVYSKKFLIKLFGLLRYLLQNNNFPLAINIFFLIIYFLQICTMSIEFISSEEDILIDILDYLKNVTIFVGVISKSNYLIIFLVFCITIILEIIMIILFSILNKRYQSRIFYLIINLINLLIYYYLIGPIIFVSLSTIYCENNIHIYLNVACYTNSKHIWFIILSLIMLLLYFTILITYSIFCVRINLIKKINFNHHTLRVNCNYDLYCLISKIIIFILHFFAYLQKGNKIYKYIYLCFIFFNCLIMSFYIIRNVYYYNKSINEINKYGWYISTWFVFCIIVKELFHIKNCSIIIIIGSIIIIRLFYKYDKMNNNLLITQMNIFELKSIKLIEVYKNILLNMKNSPIFQALKFGIINNFEDFLNNNPEINNHYQKISSNQNLIKKFNNYKDLSVLYILYIIYLYYLSKSSFKEDIIFNMSYFLINEFNNPVYAMFLCSTIKSEGYKTLFYKYILMEDIKEYLNFKINNKSHKESIKHIQIGKVILFYLYIDLFRAKIYDALCNQIDYFDILKNKITTHKMTQDFLKYGENILKLRKEIKFIWDKIIEINPFSDEYRKDYILYLESILQDELLAKEEIKQYKLIKNNKLKEKNSSYYTMFLNEKSSVLLIDGYLSSGKIIYASPNFSFIFSYQGKELLSLNIDDLIPGPVQTFHKELVENAVKYSNINYIFNEPKDSLLKNKFGEIFKIKLFVKPVPNLSYGLIYYNYIQKFDENNYIILLDKDFKIHGFSEMNNFCSLFNIINRFNSIILGYHIGLIIPNILFQLENKNGELSINKMGSELKGHLYPINRPDNLKVIVDNILRKLKFNKNNNNNELSGTFAEDSKNIIKEYNQLIKEYNIQQVTPISIFYKIKDYYFLNGKFRYYKVFINNDIISRDEFDSLIKNDILKQSFLQKSSCKINNAKNKIIKKKINDNENIDNTEKYEKENMDKKIIFKDDLKKYDDNHINNEYLFNATSNNNIIFNKIKKSIIYKLEIKQITVMKYLYYAFGLMIIIDIILDFFIQHSSFESLNQFLEDNLFFNRTKIILGVLYNIIINIRWYSHSLYINNNYCLTSNWSRFYQVGVTENIYTLCDQKNLSHYLSNEFRNILKKHFNIELYIYKYNKTKNYKYNLDNLLLFLINNEIKVLQKYSYFTNSTECKNIPKELGLNEIDLKNLAEVSYLVYYLDLNGYTGKEKAKIANQKFSKFPYTLLFSIIIFICIFIFYIYYIIFLYNIEKIFLTKLIYFNSPNFEIYIKKLEEIKKQLINDNNNDEEEIKIEEFKNSISNKKETNVVEKTKKSEKRKSKKKDKFNIHYYYKLKIKKILSFFSKKNIIFGMIISLIMLIFLSYYIISFLIAIKCKNNLINFDMINTSLENAFKESYDIFLPIMRELDKYEQKLINCKTLDGLYKMNLPTLTDIKIPKIENVIMYIIDDNDFKKESIYKFDLIFNGNLCSEEAQMAENGGQFCMNFWSGILIKGMRQAMVQMGGSIGNVISELQSINDENSNRTLLNLMNNSAFFDYKVFNEIYLFRIYNNLRFIFNEFRQEKLSAIHNIMKYILVSYILVIIFLSVFLIFFIGNYKERFIFFVNFVGIIPEKYLEDDNNFYKTIINYGKKLFT